MKHLFTLLLLMGIGFSASAQNTMVLNNRTGCDLYFNMYTSISGTCTYVGNTAYVIPAGTSLTVTAPAGEEFVFAEVTGFPFCTGGVSFDIGTPMNCNSTCPASQLDYYVGTNNGCNGCLPTINAKWDDCHPLGGILTVADY